MTNARDEGTLIGVMDINGNEIKNGDRIRVQHINYKDSSRERVDEEFIAKVFYHESGAVFLYAQENVPKVFQDDCIYHFNHRSSKFEILEAD